MSANPLKGSANDLKKSIGQIVIQADSDILELQKGYQKAKNEGSSLSKLDLEREKSLKEKKSALEDGIKNLEAKTDYVVKEKLEKVL